MAPIYYSTNFEWEEQAKKAQLFGQNFQKLAENFVKMGVFIVIRESSETNFNLVDLKKKGRQNFLKFFEHSTPP